MISNCDNTVVAIKLVYDINMYVGVKIVFKDKTTKIYDSGVYRDYCDSKCIFEIKKGQMTAVNA